MQEPEIFYDTALVGLTMNRDQLYERINDRIDMMLKEGLLGEVKTLYDRKVRNVQSIQAIGYKELYEYFDGRISLENAIEQLKQNSRRYAKRQLTWFRNKMDVAWFDMSNQAEKQKKIEDISNYIAGKLELKSNTL
jgi:tRNA dimethylallyltransferase